MIEQNIFVSIFIYFFENYKFSISLSKLGVLSNNSRSYPTAFRAEWPFSPSFLPVQVVDYIGWVCGTLGKFS